MNKKYWLPVIIIVFFCLESLFSNYVPSYFFGEKWFIIPRFLFILLLFITIFYDKKIGTIYAFVFGMLMDIVFTEIYRVYLFAYPAVIYGIYWIVKNWITNLFTMFFYTIIAVIALEIVLFFLYFMINLSDISFEYFAYHRLLPTCEYDFLCNRLFPAKKLYYSN